MIARLLLLALLLQPAPPAVTATLTPHGVAVTWSVGEVVCPWLESGSVRALATGGAGCRASGSALLTLVPDLPARVVLRRSDGTEVAGVEVGYRVVLPVITFSQAPTADA